MRRSAFLLLGLALAGGGRLGAEDPAIATIRSHYQKVQGLIASASGELWCDSIETNTTEVPAPGTGPVRSWVRLYSLVSYAEGEIGYLDPILAKVESIVQISGMVFYEEYLFQDGQLVFFYKKWGTGDGADIAGLGVFGEERFYFFDGRLIRTVFDSELSDSPDAASRERGWEIVARAARFSALPETLGALPWAAEETGAGL